MRVLIVDDETAILESLSAMLRVLGNECETAPTVADGLRLCREHSFDVALVDYAMPVMTGLDLARQIQECAPGTAVILLTAFGSTFFQREEREPDVDAVVQKPISGTRLMDVMQRVVRERREKSKQHDA